ncbi:uncharacterized protein [Coffea arabica]|uniref:Uncharacterized protein n=1 Tax=Coffea arabica TaxID=13443 RepID=A0ABM4WND5_COFAR
MGEANAHEEEMGTAELGGWVGGDEKKQLEQNKKGRFIVEKIRREIQRCCWGDSKVNCTVTVLRATKVNHCVNDFWAEQHHLSLIGNSSILSCQRISEECRWFQGERGEQSPTPLARRWRCAPSRIPPEQLIQAVAGNLPTFEAIVNYLKGQAGGHMGQRPKNSEEGPTESRTGSPDPQLKRARREPSSEHIDVGEPTHKHSRTEHPEPVRRYSRDEPSPRKEQLQVQDELDLLLDAEADRYIASPFVPDIENYPLPAKFKIPSMKPYDATTDPEDHLFAFLTQMRLQTAADAVRCKTFSMFLEGKARQWFQGLPPRSIKSFAQLARLFAAQFVSSRAFSKSMAHLMTIQQRSEESLREYMVRFNNESLQVRDRDDKVVMAAFINGLRKQKLYTELVERPPKSVREMLDRAHEKANAEEANRLKSAQERLRDDKRRRGTDQVDARSGLGRKSAYDRPPRNRSMGGDKPWTTLTAPRARVLAVMEQEGLSRPPRPLGGDKNRRDQGLFCVYHRDVGHDTEDCRHLKKDIEKLIKRGHLGQFIRGDRADQQRGRPRSERPSYLRDRPQGPQGRAPEQETQNLAGVINTIAGGPAGGDSHTARRHNRPPPTGESSAKRLKMYEEIIYGPEDAVPLASNNHEAIVIEVITCNYKVKKVYIDNGSAIDVLYYKTFKELQLEDRQLVPVRTPLIGFAGPPVRPEGMITLMVTVGASPKCRTVPVNFAVVKEPSSYNMILGRPTLNALRAVCSTLHLSMKFPTPEGVAEVLGDPKVARACYIATLKGKEKLVAQTVCLEPWELMEKGERLETDEGLTELPVQPGRPERTVKEYAEIFAWSADDMPGIPTELAVHRLQVDPGVRPVKQKKRNLAPERKEVVRSEVGKLLEAKIVKEVYYPTWLANPVLVKKEEKAWRMCVDFTDLNKACPKDCYPLPRIDQLVDSTAGYEIFCFLDAFKGYHQIALDEEDQEKTSFITEDGTYCYVTMPFGLKNAGATYQRLVNKLFRNQIGRNLEVYVDDMLVKSRTQEQFISDLREIFEILRHSRMRLNPKKCTFGVMSGKFLGYMISKEGVRANPDKIKAIMDMAPPRNIKEVQCLTGRMAALNRFLSKSAVRGAPFFKVLKGGRQFEWNPECQKAFDELKEHLVRLPALTSPEVGETLFIYLTAGEGAVSAVLVREEDKLQKPVYYVSRALQGAESRYSAIERYVLALVHAARKLRTYFQAHPVVVITDQPLRQILSKPESSGRMVKWAVELSEYDLGYQPRTAVKAQALADFIAEGVSFGSTGGEADQARPDREVEDARATRATRIPETTKAVQIREAVEVPRTKDTAEVAQASQVAEGGLTREAGETGSAPEAAEAEQAIDAAEVQQAGDAAEVAYPEETAKAELARTAARDGKDRETAEQTEPTWTLYVDGASSKEGCGAGLLLISPTGEELPYALRFDFRASNNESEYETLIAGMEMARKLGARSLKVYSDSQLIVNQFMLEQIPRSLNKRADALSKLASTSVGTLGREIVVEVVRSRAYDQVSAAVIQVVSSWMDPIVRYLAQGELPPSRIEARKILLKSQRYTLVQGVLYRKSYLQPWLRCITPEEGSYVLRELHEGICGNHVGSRVLAKKGMLAGYYWPTIFRDSTELVARCKSCQLHVPVHHTPTQEIIPLSSPWPFFQWGIDLLGPFPRAPGDYEHLVVAIDYFTKWVEAEPLGTISSRSIQKFLWKGIVCRFGIPRALVSDNDRQFADRSLQEWCTELGIRQHFTSVRHPQANGQVENINRTILHGLKTRIESARTGWLDELPTILWAYRTTPRTATQETPFALVYGVEAVIPAKIGMPSARVQHFVAQGNNEEMRLDLDLLEHKREEAAIRMTKYKSQVARYYNARVRQLSFKTGDLVLRKNSVSRAGGTGKLDPNWEGPYVVKEADRAGYCKLARLDGGEVPRTWHNSNLRLFL